MMTAPRRPRGEKPQTTIHYLQRQLANLQTTIAQQRLYIDDKEKLIAGYDVQLSESDDTERMLRNRVSDQAMRIGELSAKLRTHSERLAFLEGYYAKSQETAPVIRPIRAAGAPITGHQPETNAGAGPRNTPDLPAGGSRGESAGIF